MRARPRPVENFFTIDLEDWFHGNYVGSPQPSSTSTVDADTERLLELLDRHGARATVFCLGQVAAAHPRLVRRIHDAGHEIASHGEDHRLISSQTRVEFAADVRACKDRLEDITGAEVVGYRAPSWSITTRTLWALEVLQELAFTYDSSIFPIHTYLYGIRDAPRTPYVPIVRGAPLALAELPPATFRVWGRNVGFGGGFFLRGLPLWLQLRWARAMNADGEPFALYVHPREVGSARQPRLRLSTKEYLIYYWAIGGTLTKLEAFLRQFSCVRMRDFVATRRNALPALPVCDGGVES
jgi:polysaccharide deacetylase family protein (PEP-CTERM system associated)